MHCHRELLVSHRIRTCKGYNPILKVAMNDSINSRITPFIYFQVTYSQEEWELFPIESNSEKFWFQTLLIHNFII